MPGGGGGSGPCRCAARGSVNAAQAYVKSALTPRFLRIFSVIPEGIPFILSALLALSQSLLYLKIRCIEHGFRSPHLPTLTASGFVRLRTVERHAIG